MNVEAVDIDSVARRHGRGRSRLAHRGLTMPYLRAMNDPHGCLDVFERALSTVILEMPDNGLYPLGDYVSAQRGLSLLPSTEMSQ